MALSPVETLIAKYPLCEKLITKISDKWQKRTKGLATQWPAGGSFELALCDEMETLIKNYKAEVRKRERAQRELKRQEERKILALFKQEGQQLLKQNRKRSKKADETDRINETIRDQLNTPPPYREGDGQFPLVKGVVDFKRRITDGW